MLAVKANTIDDFIAAYPAPVQKMLQQLRSAILKAAPDGEECINYGIPTIKLEGNLVHFSGYKNHIGFYPGASGIRNFSKELTAYQCSKGTVQFPLDQPLPLELITAIVKFRIAENLQKAALKKKSKTKPVQEDGFTSFLAAPAQRALQNKGIINLKQLAKYSEEEILTLHGMGKSSLPKLRKALSEKGLSFKSS